MKGTIAPLAEWLELPELHALGNLGLGGAVGRNGVEERSGD